MGSSAPSGGGHMHLILPAAKSVGCVYVLPVSEEFAPRPQGRVALRLNVKVNESWDSRLRAEVEIERSQSEVSRRVYIYALFRRKN